MFRFCVAHFIFLFPTLQLSLSNSSYQFSFSFRSQQLFVICYLCSCYFAFVCFSRGSNTLCVRACFQPRLSLSVFMSLCLCLCLYLSLSLKYFFILYIIPISVLSYSLFHLYSNITLMAYLSFFSTLQLFCISVTIMSSCLDFSFLQLWCYRNFSIF